MNKHIYSLIVIALLIAIPGKSNAQGPLSSRLVTAPTAGTLSRNTFVFDTQLYDGGGLVHSINYGLIDLIDIGVSYGGSNVIGASRITWQPHVAAQLRIRVIEETLTNPAVAIGFNSQGDGPYVKGDSLNRFRNKSRGFFCALSRNYSLLGDFGLHGGVNFTLEVDDGDHDPSFWAGFNKSVGSFIDLCGEYDFATNDNEDKSITSDRGYLNAAVKWKIGDAFVLEFDLKNILQNTKRDFTGRYDAKPEPSREIRLYYYVSF